MSRYSSVALAAVETGKLSKDCHEGQDIQELATIRPLTMVHEDSASPQVLVVEDERNIRDLVCSHLESEDYQCEAVVDGPQALALVEQRRFDVVVLDLMLPGAAPRRYVAVSSARDVATTFRISLPTGLPRPHDVGTAHV